MRKWGIDNFDICPVPTQKLDIFTFISIKFKPTIYMMLKISSSPLSFLKYLPTNSMSKMAKLSRQLTGICSRSVAYEILHPLDSSFPLLEFVTLAFKITISWTTTQLSIFFYLYNHTALRIDTLSSYYS